MDSPASAPAPPIHLGTVKATRPTSSTPNACTPCRRAKMKCNPGTDLSAPCLRCQRKQFSCVYETHRRGRKPGSSKLRVRIQSLLQSSVSPTSPPVVRNHLPASGSGSRTLQAASTDGEAEDQHPAAFLRQNHDKENVSAPNLVASKVGKKADALSPFRLLNRHAMTGNFCVQNVLEPEHSSAANNNIRAESSKGRLSRELHDPVAIGLINLPAAMQLFDSFLKYMLPYIIHFDPILHTFEYVQQSSPFLLVSILSASSKIFNPDLYSKLYQYSEELLAKTFMSGEKSVEIVQAVLMKTYWKEPDDSRVWQLVGYASRMCAELRGRKSRTPKRVGPSVVVSELDLRKQRNLERTWLTLFVYDRSVSLQVGKPWMLHEDDLVRTVNAWYSHDLKMAQNDAILAAFVQLRAIGSDMLDVLDMDLSSNNQELREISLNLLDTELEKWEDRWNKMFQTVKLEPCHLFLSKFYGLHFRLYVNSLRLQGVLISSGNIAKKALWSSYSSAKKMLEAIIEILGPAQLLYFAQDSIHVMTAYAAVFLTKLLLSLPEALPASAESTIIDLLSTTSRVFSEQCVTAKTSCAYQARFLRNVVTQYWTSKASAAEAQSPLQNIPARSQPSTQHCDLGSLARVAAQAEYHPSYNANGENSIINPSFQDPEAESRTRGEQPQSSSFAGAQMRLPDPSGLPSWEPDIWEGLFVDAGFNIDDGALMSSIGGGL